MVCCQGGWKFTFWAKDVINTDLLVFFGLRFLETFIPTCTFPHKRWGDDLAGSIQVSGWFDPADFPLLVTELPQTFGYPNDFQRRYGAAFTVFSVWLFAGQ